MKNFLSVVRKTLNIAKFMIKTIIIFVGIYVCVLWTSGELGVGHFRLYYGSNPVSCTAIEQSLNKD